MIFPHLDPKKLYVLPLGVGNAFTRRFFNSSLLLIAARRLILVDCPSPLRRILADAGTPLGVDLEIGDIDHIVLTHLHGDHCNGLEEFGFFSYYALQQKRAHLYTLPENIQPLWDNRLSAAMGDVLKQPGDDAEPRTLDRYFQIHEWEPGRKHPLAEEPDLKLEFTLFRTQHSLPCFGFVAQFGVYRLAYSGDTSFSREIIDQVADADLIIHEMGPSGNHTSLDDLLALDRSVTDKMLLIHAPDEYHDSPHPRLPALRQGALYEVGSGRHPRDDCRKSLET